MRKGRDLRIGIDVGGTNTDAVIVDARDRPIAKQKVPTTADVTGGIKMALEGVLNEVPDARRRVSHVMVGTTHAPLTRSCKAISLTASPCCGSPRPSDRPSRRWSLGQRL